MKQKKENEFIHFPLFFMNLNNYQIVNERVIIMSMLNHECTVSLCKKHDQDYRKMLILTGYYYKLN